MKVRFGACELDGDARELRRAGELVDVQPQVFSVIEYLIRHRERAVPKEELLDEIWGDRFVSESTLTSRIKFARRAVGDDGAAQQVIKTVHGHGYRFVAEVHDHDSPGDVPSDPVEDTPPTALAEMEDGWPFVGRVEELNAALSTLTRADSGGVAVRGPARIGATRFAEEVRRSATVTGRPSWWVQGLASTTAIPLAGVAHLLPPGVLDTSQTVAELVRADMFRTAHAALTQRAGDQRPIVVLDDAHLLDSLSAAVLSSMMTARTISTVVTGRFDGQDEPPIDIEGMVQRGLLRPIDLGPLDEIDVDVLLYRALSGPMDDESLRSLSASSRRRPGLLRDVVETSQRSGVLEQRDGTWRLTGVPSSTESNGWPPAGMTPGAEQAAVDLALLGSVDLDVLIDLVGEDELDELDRAGLLAVDGSASRSTVSLVDQLLASTVLESTGPLRRRRSERRLAQELPVLTDAPWALATIAEWDRSYLADLPSATVLGASLQAMISGDFTAAEALADVLDHAQEPAARVVLAEVAILSQRWQRAERLLDDLDMDELDPMLASIGIRRRLGIAFTHRARHDDALEQLGLEAARRSGSVADALRVRRLAQLAVCGRYEQLFDEVRPLLDLEGVARVELLGALATAELGQGRIARSLELVDEATGMAEAVVPAPWRTEAVDGLVTVRVSAHLQAGELDEASRLVDEALPAGQRSRLGLLPALGAEVAMDLGRPRYARELIRATVASSRRQEFPHYLGLAEVILARVDLAQGRHDDAAAGAETARAAMDDAPGVMRWRIASSLAEIDQALGRDAGMHTALVALADEAAAVGARIAEADLLFQAATLDASPEAAQTVVTRLGALIDTFEGPLWSLRLDHVSARARRRPLDDIEARYRTLGHRRYAQRAAEGR